MRGLIGALRGLFLLLGWGLQVVYANKHAISATGIEVPGTKQLGVNGCETGQRVWFHVPSFSTGSWARVAAGATGRRQGSAQQRRPSGSAEATQRLTACDTLPHQKQLDHRSHRAQRQRRLLMPPPQHD